MEERSTVLMFPNGAGLHCTLRWQNWKGKQDEVELFRFPAKEEEDLNSVLKALHILYTE